MSRSTFFWKEATGTRFGMSILTGTVSGSGPALQLLCRRNSDQVLLLGLRNVIPLLVAKLKT